jgi:hypothetical protein
MCMPANSDRGRNSILTLNIRAVPPRKGIQVDVVAQALRA